MIIVISKLYLHYKKKNSWHFMPAKLYLDIVLSETVNTTKKFFKKEEQ
jgi:hypothetical protein